MSRSVPFSIALCTLVILLCGLTHSNFAQDDVTSADEVFQSRILPIFKSSEPSSCVQCHLSAVDLKTYIRPSAKETFASLRDQGMIDLESPKKSQILELIRMGEDDFDKGARLIHKKQRDAEYQAFSKWIIACCSDDEFRKLPKSSEDNWAKPTVDDQVIRHGRKGRLMNSFVRNIWSQRLRCFPCHTPNDIQPNQIKAREKYDDFVAQYGARMALFEKTPLATMKSWIRKSDSPKPGTLPLLNLKEPQNSLVVLKPLAKLPPRVDGKFAPPSYQVPVSHMGGLKMHLNDQSYKSFLAWITDLSKLKSGKYVSIDQLPNDNWFATKRVLRMKEAPESWKPGTVVQLKVYRWMPDANDWSTQPFAFTQGTVTPRRMVNGALFLLAPKPGEARRKWAANRNKFKPGKYLVKVFVDSAAKIEKEPELILGKDYFAGQIEIQNARWRTGFPKAEMILGSAMDGTHSQPQ